MTVPEVRILLNTNVKMTRHKAAAQAVHAALYAFGIPHGRVVVLGARPDEVGAMTVVIRDAGLTEVEPGTLTAGATVIGGPETADKNLSNRAGRVGREWLPVAQVARLIRLMTARRTCAAEEGL